MRVCPAVCLRRQWRTVPAKWQVTYKHQLIRHTVTRPPGHTRVGEVQATGGTAIDLPLLDQLVPAIRTPLG